MPRPCPCRPLLAAAAAGSTPRLHALVHALAGAGLLAAALPALAQDSGAQQIEVRGTRAALERSVVLKRNAPTVQDSITATELGRFPDDNVADSLSHITGVSITRGPGGEGRTVSVRGLGPAYTLTTFNGRLLGTDGAGRDFAFDVLPSDVISGADVIKGAQAAHIEGAIGGLVNLRSASPFDQKGQHGILRLEGDYNLMSRKAGTKLSATYSNTFAGNTWGVLFGAVVANRTDRTDTAGNDGGWSRNPNPNDPSWLWGNTWGGAIDPNGNGTLDPDEYGLYGPGQFRVGSILQSKKRLALSGKVEWRPTPGLKITADAIGTRLDAPEIGYQQSFYPLFAPGRWSNMQISNGIVTGMTLDNPDPEMRLNPELLNLSAHRVVDTHLLGLNAQWQATPSLSLTADGYHSTSKRHSGGQDTYVVLRMNQPNVSTIQLTGQPVPDVVTTFADGRDLTSGLANGQFTANDFNTHYMRLEGDNIDDKITGLGLTGKWTLGHGAMGITLDQLQFGVQYSDRRKSRDLINNELTGGSGYYSGSNAINVGTLGGNLLRTLALSNFMNKVGGSFPRTFLAFDVPDYLNRLRAVNDGIHDFNQAAAQWNPLKSYRVTERTTSAYVQADLSGERWSGDIGLRFVNTRTTAQAWDAKIQSITANGPWNFTANYAPPTPVTQANDYNTVLPSANFVFNLQPDLLLRLGLAKTMARPNVDQLAPTNTTESVAWGEFTQIYGGNVALKPYSAVQADLGLEWYFTPKSIFNVALYQKNIKNQITTSWEPNTDIGVPGYLFNIIRPINGDTAKARGFEIGLQHLWANGFGMRLQYTKTDSVSWVGGLQRPLEGIAPTTASAQVLYEKGPWSFSMTADHTAAFISAVNVLGEGVNEEVQAITWLTAQAAYEINDKIRVTIEGRNLLDSQERYMLQGKPLMQQGYNRYGRGITVGVQVRF